MLNKKNSLEQSCIDTSFLPSLLENVCTVAWSISKVPMQGHEGSKTWRTSLLQVGSSFLHSPPKRKSIVGVVALSIPQYQKYYPVYYNAKVVFFAVCSISFAQSNNYFQNWIAVTQHLPAFYKKEEALSRKTRILFMYFCVQRPSHTAPVYYKHTCPNDMFLSLLYTEYRPFLSKNGLLCR